MVEEGELKKRIEQNSCIVLKGIKLTKKELLDQTVYDPIAIDYREIVDMFEEAKKEFPIEIVPYKNEIGFKFYGTKNAQKKLGETVLWFIKWFGE